MRPSVRRALTATLTAALALGAALAASPAAEAAGATTGRIQGENRYYTSVAITTTAFPGQAATVFVASGEQFPDALAGGAAAARHGAPLLLTQQGQLPGIVRGEIQRLTPSEIVVLGGSAVVGDSVINDLTLLAPKVTVIAGADRYDTAARIAAAYLPTGGPAYVASGQAFPDALAGASAAVKASAPVLLTPTASLSPHTAKALADLSTSEVRILGGSAAVAESVEDDLKESRSVTRLRGGDRYDTAVEVSKASFGSAATVYLASGQNFPDALSGAPLAAGTSPILLVRQDAPLPNSVCAEIGRLKATSVVALGGEGAISQAVLDAAGACAAGTTAPPAIGTPGTPIPPVAGCTTTTYDVTAAKDALGTLVAGVREVDARINGTTGFAGAFTDLKSGADRLAAAGAPGVCAETLHAIKGEVQAAYNLRDNQEGAKAAYATARARIEATLPSLNAGLRTNHHI